MGHFFSNIISCGFTLIKLSFIKLFHLRNLYFTPVTRFSPDVKVGVSDDSCLEIGKRVIARSGAKLVATAGGKLTIGQGSGFGHFSIVVCRHSISIGKDVYCGPNTLIYDHDHDFRDKDGIRSRKYKCAPISIGDGTWIGANTVILRGTTIGKNCVIGAGSVVKGNVPDNTILVQKRENIFIPVKEHGVANDE